MLGPGTRLALLRLSAAQLTMLWARLPGTTPMRITDVGAGRVRITRVMEEHGLRIVAEPSCEMGCRLIPPGGDHEPTNWQRITVLARRNPKRQGTASHARFQLYRDGMTVREYMNLAMATGVSRHKARLDVYADTTEGHIRVTPDP